MYITIQKIRVGTPTVFELQLFEQDTHPPSLHRNRTANKLLTAVTTQTIDKNEIHILSIITIVFNFESKKFNLSIYLTKFIFGGLHLIF